MMRIVLGFVLGAGLVVAGLNLLPDRLPVWLGGHPAPLEVAATSLAAAQRRPRLTVLAAPQDVRYRLDLSTLKLESMRWDAEGRTLTIHAPRPVRTGPDGAAVAAPDAMPDAAIARLADEAAREAVQRMFLLPLIVAGHEDVKVKVTFAGPAPTSAPAIEQD
jgi:hypothetical protein